MGCDIHLHTEVKINGTWEHHSVAHIDRNYELFSKMADCGRDGECAPLAPNRGIPADATSLTKFDCKIWSGCGHSHSWLNATEIFELCEWANAKFLSTRLNWENENIGFLFGGDWS